MIDIPDAPEIRMTEATGYPTETTWPRCPVCGEKCSFIYRDRDGETVGCDRCVSWTDAWEESL